MEIKNQKLDRFVNAVNFEVDNQIEEILEEAECESKKIIDKASDQYLYQAYDKIKNEVKRLEAKFTKITAQSELDAKKCIILCREKLTSQLFENIKSKINDFTKSDKYLDFLKKQLEDVELNDYAVISLRPQDMNLSEEIKKATKCQIVEDASIELGGLAISYTDKTIMIDKTIDSALEQARKDFNGSNCFSLC